MIGAMMEHRSQANAASEWLTATDFEAGFDYSPASQIVARAQMNDLYEWMPSGAATVDSTANGLNQVTSVDGAALEYDDRGNLTDDGVWSYSYDVENRLRSATGPASVTLGYDPVGRLAESAVAGMGTTEFLYDGSDLVAEFDGAGNVIRRYVHGPGVDEPLVWYEGAGTSDRRYVHADERGSVIALSNSSGAAIATWQYSPYGQSTGSSFSRFGFTGQTVIEGTEIMHFKARAYSPALGRFLQPDPIGFAGGDTNLYSYAANDPVNFTDPSGLIFGKIFKGLKKAAKFVVKGAKKGLGILRKAGRFAVSLNSETALGQRVLRFAAAQALDFAIGGLSGDGGGNAGAGPPDDLTVADLSGRCLRFTGNPADPLNLQNVGVVPEFNANADADVKSEFAFLIARFTGTGEGSGRLKIGFGFAFTIEHSETETGTDFRFVSGGAGLALGLKAKNVPVLPDSGAFGSIEALFFNSENVSSVGVRAKGSVDAKLLGGSSISASGAAKLPICNTN